MADDKLDISSIFGDTFKQISDALSGETQKKSKKKVSLIAGIPLPQSSSTSKKSTSKKKTTTKKTSALDKATMAGVTAAKKASTTKKTTASKTTTAKKTTASKTTSSKKAGKIMLEINGRQVDFKTIEQKAAKLGGNCYVVVNEKKIYNEDGKSVSLFS